MKDKSAYEVQQFCLNYMRNEYVPTTDEDRPFTECAAAKENVLSSFSRATAGPR